MPKSRSISVAYAEKRAVRVPTSVNHAGKEPGQDANQCSAPFFIIIKLNAILR